MANSTSYSTLLDAIQLLEEDQIIKRQLLKEQLNISYESLKPLNLLQTAIRDLSSTPDLGNNVLGSVLGLASGFLSKKVFIGTSGNLIRKLLGSFIQLGVTNIVAKHPEAIKTFVQYLIQYFNSGKKPEHGIMSAEEVKLPLYIKVTVFLVGLFAFLSILYIGKSILVPLVFATIIAILINPVVDFLVRIKLNRVLSIAVVMLLTFLIIFAFVSLIISQVNRLTESWPVLVEKITGMINQNIADAATYFDKDPQKIHLWIAKTQAEIISSSTAAIGQTLVIVGSGLIILFLLPVYIFLILFYQPIILEFIHRLFGSDHQSKVSEIVSQVKTLIQRYLFGLVIEAAIIAGLETAALLVLGIEYALLIAIFGALLNMIPYIGGLVAVAVPMIVALVTKPPVFALYVLISYYVIQLIDNNYIVPKIVASKVKINALFSIIVVIAGNALWGIPGMFLSIPLLAIVKLLCDHIEPLKPIGFLLGDTMPSILKIKLPVLKSKKQANSSSPLQDGL